MTKTMNVVYKYVESPSEVPIWGSELACIGNMITVTTARFNTVRLQDTPGQLTGMRSIWLIDDQVMTGYLHRVEEWSADHPQWQVSKKNISVLHRDVILAKFLMVRWGKKKLRHRIKSEQP